ncbi:SYNERG-CTERM sorting domain-containing protein [Aminithiophilus ramosus]|uniref:SYNERG-CTERM sorting domain-containing protein n=1 Tax=Aminithiophilus ramosus TaxID=3029084 RepID=A0A9Q7ABD5_9BACT|nr:M14 family zinc carboxypeptidase [Aminithiophilus ramosus]QTX33735.1 SYNERG-CTERM sorting domain-containing protein [Aminithiophilus ramosus]
MKKLFQKIIPAILSLFFFSSMVFGGYQDVTGTYGPDGPFYSPWSYSLPQAVLDFHIAPEGIQYDTPGFKDGKRNFTSHKEMIDFINGLSRENMTLKTLGEYPDGFSMPVMIFAENKASSPEELLSLGRPIVWIQAQIHGNEPAAGEAALVLAERLADGDLTPLLKKLSVVMLPRINADGSKRFDRLTFALGKDENSAEDRNTNMRDMNRDHLLYEVPATRAVHGLFNAYMPHVAIDHHEYGPIYRYNGAEYYKFHDILTMFGVNLNIPETVRAMSEELFEVEIAENLQSNGLSHHWYYTGSGNAITEGGFDARIGRNAFGLLPSISFLVESRGIGIGREDFLRRVYAHVTTAEAILETTADNADTVLEVVEAARNDEINNGATISSDDVLVVTMETVAEPISFDLINTSGDLVNINITGHRARTGHPVLERIRPLAYLFSGDVGEKIVEKLIYAGASIERFSEDTEVEVEFFIKRNTGYKISKDEFLFTKDAYVVFMDQPQNGLISQMTEPEASYSVTGILTDELSPDLVLPVYRYLASNKLPTYTSSVIMPEVSGAVIKSIHIATNDEKMTAQELLQKNNTNINVMFLQSYFINLHDGKDSFFMTLPSQINGTNITTWYLYQWANQEWEQVDAERLSTAALADLSLPVSKEFIDSTGEVRLIGASATATTGDSGSSGCSVGFAPAIILLLIPAIFIKR